MDSQAFDLPGMVSAVVKATEVAGGELSNWTAAQKAGPAALRNQEELLRRLGTVARDLTRIPELRAWAAWTADEINRILAEEGFEIRADPWPADAFGVVAILDITVEWLRAGEEDEVRTGPSLRKYPAFRLDAVENRVEVHDVPGSDRPLVRLATKTGDVVCIHVMPSANVRLFQLYDTARQVSSSSRANPIRSMNLRVLTVPKIKLRQWPDVSWMQDMGLAGTSLRSQPKDLFLIEKALQEVRFAMNEQGARAKTASVVVPRAADSFLKIDDDFLFWIERPGVSIPVFVGYFAKDSWQDPGSLDNV